MAAAAQAGGPVLRSVFSDETRMSRRACRTVVFALCAASLCAPITAQEAGVTAKLHPWGRFDPGVWKTVRVVTETLDEDGQVVSTTTTDTKTTLLDIDNEGVTLEIQTCTEVAGKRFEAEPQTIKQSFHGELFGPDLTLKSPVASQVVIDGVKVPCHSQEVDSVAPTGKTKTTIYYSLTLAPYILKRESTTTDPEGKSVLCGTNVEILMLNMPVRLKSDGGMRNGIYVKTVHKSPKSVVTSWATVLPEVPGGVVAGSTREVDGTGRMVRRSILELSDYDAESGKDRSGAPGRKRPPRHRSKPPSRYGS
jgi:hypothetical protein